MIYETTIGISYSGDEQVEISGGTIPYALA